jgi:hypothetical protein
MPLQNRVTPFGEIIAIDQRGLFTGNRGIIHDPTTRTLLTKRWATRTWLVCSCDYNGVRRRVMGGRSWTELFFLDEATALAAGHRPCFLCRHDAAEKFRAAWCRGNGGHRPKASEMDNILHQERLEAGRKRLHPSSLEQLPTGAMFVAQERAFLAVESAPFEWTSSGYRSIQCPPGPILALTPPSTMRALQAGYRPILHPSLQEARGHDNDG